MGHRAHPPTAAEVHRAIQALGVSDDRSVWAALHLSLPVDSVLTASRTGHLRVTWRGSALAARPDVETACALAASGARPGDRFLDLEGPPEHWLKVLPSGSRLVAFGSDELFGLGNVAAEPATPTDAVRDGVQALRATAGGHRLPVMVTAAGGHVLADPLPRGWVLRWLPGPA